MTELEQRACDMRIDIVRMIAEAGSGHPGGSLSCTDILTALYFGGVMDHDPEQPKWEDRDRFVLAKGHAAPALYAALAHAGYFPREELKTLRKLGTRLQGHPDCNLCPGVEVSTGSLGQGLSIAAGMAAGLKLTGKPQRVFCAARRRRVRGGPGLGGRHVGRPSRTWTTSSPSSTATICRSTATPPTCATPATCAPSSPLSAGRRSQVDGHDIDALIKALNAAKRAADGRPHVLVANTIKGRGVSFMENQAGWHGKAPNAEQTEQARSRARGRT